MVTQALGRHIEGIALQADWAAVIYGQKWSSCRGNRETGSQGPLPEVRLTEPGASKTLTAKTRSWTFSRRRWGTVDRFKARERHGPFMASPGLESSPCFQGPCWWAMSSLWRSTKVQGLRAPVPMLPLTHSASVYPGLRPRVDPVQASLQRSDRGC